MRPHLVPRPDPPVNVAAAKAAMQRERADVEQKVGMKFETIVCAVCGQECEGCGVSESQALGRAEREYAAHYLATHIGGAA